jgi:hypothetical protein
MENCLAVLANSVAHLKVGTDTRRERFDLFALGAIFDWLIAVF